MNAACASVALTLGALGQHLLRIIDQPPSQQLVDHGVTEQDVLGAPVEPTQEQRRLLRISTVKARGEARRSANRTPMYCLMPPGGENSTDVTQTVGFLRDRR
jgi:hypothetical protein